MQNFVRRALEVYLREHRILTESEFESDVLPFLNQKNAVFVTLYSGGKVIASQGRIQCQKKNTLYECLDLSLACLTEQRFQSVITSPEMLENVQIRVDLIPQNARRILQNISDLNIREEWVIFLSQNLGKMSVILPNMIKNDPSPELYFEFAKQKAGITESLTNRDYVIYGLKTQIFTDF